MYRKMNWQNTPSKNTLVVKTNLEDYLGLKEKDPNVLYIVENPPPLSHHDKLVPLICERCGGTINKETYKCEHCGTQYEWR